MVLDLKDKVQILVSSLSSIQSAFDVGDRLLAPHSNVRGAFTNTMCWDGTYSAASGVKTATRGAVAGFDVKEP